MKSFSTLRAVVPVLVLFAVVLLASCASSSKKYGCPNKMQASSLK